MGADLKEANLDDYVFNEWKHPRKADVFAKVVGDFRAQKAFKKLLESLQTESSNISREQA